VELTASDEGIHTESVGQSQPWPIRPKMMVTDAPHTHKSLCSMWRPLS